MRFEVDEYNRSIKQVQKQIGDLIKNQKQAEYGAAESKEPATVQSGTESLLSEKAELERLKVIKEKEMSEKESTLSFLLSTVGNIVHESVVDSKNEDDNEIVRFWHKNGEDPKAKAAIADHSWASHADVLYRLDGYDPERGTKVAGHRGYFLKNDGVRLNQALIQYGLSFLTGKEYTLLQTPFMMKRDMMAKTAQLEEFDESLYKIIGDQDVSLDSLNISAPSGSLPNLTGTSDMYMIATSEQPISAFHADEWIPLENLPLKYAGYSTCFRKEAGAHGRDTWGIFRVHQFEKVEQFCDFYAGTILEFI